MAELNRCEANLYVWDRHTTSNKIVHNFIKSRFTGNAGEILERINEISVGTEHTFLDSDNTGVVFMSEPSASRAELTGAREVFSAAKLFQNYLFTGLFVRRDFLQSNREEVVRFVVAVERALQFIAENKGTSIDIAIHEFHSTDSKVVLRAMTRMFLDELFPRHTAVDQEGWITALKVRFGTEASNFPFFKHVDVTVSQDARKRLAKRSAGIKLLSKALKWRSHGQADLNG